jgi:putative tricarboxylic transport membrane protein
MLGLALLALALRWFAFPLAPLLLGFILSGLLEENVRRTLFIAEGDWTALFTRPAFVVLGLMIFAVWLIPVWQRRRAQRDN